MFRTFHRSRFGFILALALLSLAGGGAAHAATGPTSKNAQQAQTRHKLAIIKQRIAKLARQQRDTASRRDALSATLAAQADKLDAAAKAVRASDDAIAAKRKQIQQLDAQRAPIEKRLKDQRQALAQLLRAAYALGRGSDLRLLLGDADVARIGRALAYSQYFQRDRIKHIKSLMQDLNHLQQLKSAIAREQQALEAERATRTTHMQALTAARDKQRKLLAATRARIKQQGQELDQLKRNQHNLNQLLARLSNVFADIPKVLPDDVPFARRRGHLPWPVRGKLRSSGEGVSIDARRGAPVRAVAHGRVAYANWLRGYGMLIIIDHGNGWMSLYGDNESLLRSVGDWVDAGERIGTAGIESGGHEGIYFGLRHKGKPVNPRPWLARHR